MREPHLLKAGKKTKRPRRMVFFDAEAKTTVDITQDEIDRALQNAAGTEKVPVIKEHDLYSICASFVRDRRSERGKLTRQRREYFAPCGTWAGGNRDFLIDFWRDVDRFATYNETLHMFAHNAKYDTLVTQAVWVLVTRFDYTTVSFSDNPYITELEKAYCPCCKGLMKRETGRFYCPDEKCDAFEEWNPKGYKKKTILILSSTNFFAMSLKKLGETFKLPKLDFDHGRGVEPDDPEFMRDAMIYNHRDVEILETAMLHFMDFIGREGLGNFSKTVAGQSFAAFRTRFMQTDIYIHDNRGALEVERRAYAGGRNECFSMGRVDNLIFYVDINSMYPHVMRSFKYPTKLLWYWETGTIKQVKREIDNGRLIVCDCLVSTEYPIFHQRKERLTFPVGTFWTALTTPEIEEGLKRGLIKDVRCIAVYEAGDIFSSYVNFFYNERLKAKAAGDDVHDLLYKLFMNSLYGKWGELNIHWERIGDCDPDIVDEYYERDRVTKQVQLIKRFGGGVFVKHDDPDDREARNSFPAIAAHVTAHARLLLWSYIELAGIEHVHYCDTDSLFVDAWGFQRLWAMDAIDNKRLGALKVEAYDTDLHLYGCKDYVFHQKVKLKGVRHDAVELEPDAQGRKRYAMTQWGGMTDRLRDQDMTRFYNKVVVKVLARTYKKGTIEHNRVEPLRLDHFAEERAKREILRAQMEAAAAEVDELKELCLEHGYIRAPKRGQRYFTEYRDYISMKAKGRYFRRDRGQLFDAWCASCGVDPRETWEQLKTI